MVILALANLPIITMGKSSNFFGQPIYGQLIKSLDREKIIEMSRKHGGEKYVKSFDGYTHLLTMLYAVIQRFDSLREIETSMTAEVRKLHYVGIEPCLNAVHFLMQMPDDQRSSLRRSIVTCMMPTRPFFHRTAGGAALRNG